MENLRWILIIAGVAILVMLWLTGRGSRRRTELPAAGGRDARGRRAAADPLLGDEPLDPDLDFLGDTDPDDFARPAGARSFVAGGAQAAAFGQVGAAPGAGGFGGLAQKFESIGERLAPRRRQRIAAAEPESEEARAPAASTKIVTLYVCARGDGELPPEALAATLERRGYHYGEREIYHSMHEGRSVFSVARMIKPGTFDPDDLETFLTPGIALILQLPAPVPADTAFEVMLDEAREMAEELDAEVLDGARNPLRRQTEQHLRESIYEYMHREKYLADVAAEA